jgi:hypothetical protein
MADASNFEIFVATAVGAWGMAHIVFSVNEIMNGRRDAVILSALEGEPLTKDHKLLILQCDWLPMAAGLLVILLIGLGSAFVASDYLEDRFKIVAGLLKWTPFGALASAQPLAPKSPVRNTVPGKGPMRIFIPLMEASNV